MSNMKGKRERCTNILTAKLIVVEPPVCIPQNPILEENRLTSFSCQVVSSEGLRPHLRWVRGRSSDPGSVIYLTDKTMSTFDLNPSYFDHGSSLRCEVSHDHWNESLPLLSCGYNHLNIIYGPQLRCQREHLFPEDASKFNISCDILSNPLVPAENISWEFEDRDSDALEDIADVDSLYSARQRPPHQTSRLPPATGDDRDKVQFLKEIPYGVHVVFPLSKNYLSAGEPEKTVWLRVTGHSGVASKRLTLRLLVKPRVDCPTLRILPTVAAQERGVAFNVTCSVIANPPVPESNITWEFSRGYKVHVNRFSKEQRVVNYSGKMVVSLAIPPFLFADEALEETLTLKIRSGESVIAKNILLQSQRSRLVSTFVGGDDFDADAAWLSSHGGVVVLVLLFLLFLVLLSVVVVYVIRRRQVSRQKQRTLERLRQEGACGEDVVGVSGAWPYAHKASTMVATLYKADKQKAENAGDQSVYQAAEEELAAMEIPPSELAYHPMQRWTTATMDRGKPLTAMEGAGAMAGIAVPCSANGGPVGTLTLAARMGGAPTLGGCVNPVGLNPSSGAPPGPGPGSASDRSEEEDSWFYGFLGLARALHAKDADSDGFHGIDEVRKLVKSYNLVYKLQLEDGLMEEIILQCSNGVQVDIESLLRMLALEAP